MSVAEDVKVEKADKVAKAAEGKSAPGGLAGVVGWPGRKIAEARAFLTEVRAELKKVTWPSRKETLITTAMVFAMSILAAIFFMVVDQILGFGVRQILGFGG